MGPWNGFEQECAGIYKSLRETRSWDNDPSHPQERHLGLGGPNGKEERGRGSWLQEETAAMLGTVAEPAVGVGTQRGSCVLRSDGEFGFKHHDFKRTEFLYVGMKTFKSH